MLRAAALDQRETGQISYLDKLNYHIFSNKPERQIPRGRIPILSTSIFVFIMYTDSTNGTVMQFSVLTSCLAGYRLNIFFSYTNIHTRDRIERYISYAKGQKRRGKGLSWGRRFALSVRARPRVFINSRRG